MVIILGDELDYRLRLLEEKINTLENKILQLETQIQLVVNSNNQISMILKYVVTPLIIIMGGLVGVNVYIKP